MKANTMNTAVNQLDTNAATQEMIAAHVETMQRRAHAPINNGGQATLDEQSTPKQTIIQILFMPEVADIAFDIERQNNFPRSVSI
jgi:hypothetical protein